MRVPSHEKNIWCYKRKQPLFSEMKKTILHIVFLQELPENLNDDSFLDSRYPSFYILDDLMSNAINSQGVSKLFVEGSHHTKLSVSYIVQNAFSMLKDSRTFSSNSEYIVLFENPRDRPYLVDKYIRAIKRSSCINK